MKKIILFASLAVGSHSALGQDLNAAADDVCTCFEEPYAAMEDMVGDILAAEAHGDFGAMMAKQGELMSMMGAAQTCFSELPAKYPEIDASDELKYQVMEIVDQQCPNPLENINFGPGG